MCVSYHMAIFHLFRLSRIVTIAAWTWACWWLPSQEGSKRMFKRIDMPPLHYTFFSHRICDHKTKSEDKNEDRGISNKCELTKGNYYCSCLWVGEQHRSSQVRPDLDTPYTIAIVSDMLPPATFPLLLYSVCCLVQVHVICFERKK